VKPPYVTDDYLNRIIAGALEEDTGSGDHSSMSTISPEARGHAHLLIKENGIIAGLEVFSRVFRTLDPGCILKNMAEDGAAARYGDIVLSIEGSVRSILGAERVALNFLQRMSGIATHTRNLCRLLEGTNVQLLDTRKTTPLLRPLEKWAVLLGGGANHRMGLYDMIMLKDNHIDFAGGIVNAVQQAREYLRIKGLDLQIEVETRTLDEVAEAISCRDIDMIMLDNMDPDTMRKAVEMVAGQVPTEASGGITEDTIRAVALAGVDYISVGALTHTVKSLDMSLQAVIE
jgi:nicotinate-nucleotide pyrophosphorylase (carboxylating)